MSSETQKFLETVLPAEGFKGVFTLPNKRIQWFDDFSAMAEAIHRADTEGNHVYHTCAAYPKGGPRKAHVAIGARSLWLDVDAGDGKAYADAREAFDAVRLWRQRAALEPPVVVGSGNGLHLYWPMETLLDPATWRALANGLRVACEKHGLEVDVSRTCDLASLLRPVGSWNRKRGSQLVEWNGPVGPYRVEQFEGLRHGNTARLFRPSKFATLPEMPLHVRARRLVPDAATVFTDEPSDADTIAERCEQLRNFKDSRGCLAEPTWYAALGVLAYTTQGHDACHDWSSGHPNYSVFETDKKIAQQEKVGQPVTCDHFAKINPKGCEGCPHKGHITTPLQLGRANYSRKSVETPFAKLFETGRIEKANDVHALPDLPKGFRWHEGSLCLDDESKEGNPPTKISSAPIWLHDVQTKEINSDKFSYRFMLDLPKDGRREIVIGAKDFWSPQGLSILQGSGAIIHHADGFKQYTRAAVDMFNRDHHLERAYEQFGWKENDTAFLYGNRLYRSDSVAMVVGSPEVVTRSQWLAPTRGGSLAAWSDAANALFTTGCEAQSFSLLCAFAAPLMRFHSTDEGGAVVSLVSRDSGTGKSTALAAAASVWGLRKGLKLEGIDTKIAKGLTLGVLGNLPVVYDEVWMRDPEVIREFILTFTNGSDKQRATRDGEIRHSQATWQTILLTASNSSLTDIIGASQGPEATKWRIMEFDAALPKDIEHQIGDRLKKTLEANCGYAGDHYLSYLVQDNVLQWTKAAVELKAAEIWARTKWKAEHRFWVRTLASASIAADLVKRMELLQFDAPRILTWALERLGGIEQTFTATTASAVHVLNDFLNSSIDKTLVVNEAWSQGKRSLTPLLKPMRHAAIRLELDTRTICVTWTEFKEWLVKRHHSVKQITEELMRVGVITARNRAVTLGAGTELAAGQVLCFIVNGQHPEMIGGEFLRVVQPDTIQNVVPMQRKGGT